MIKGIIFDKDGVLFDSEPIYANSIVRTLDRLGIPFTENEFFDYFTRKGGTTEQFVKEMNVDLPKFKEIRDEILSFEFNKKLPIIPGVEEALTLFHPIYPMALATASDRRITNLKLNLSGFGKFFRHVVTKEDVSRQKPHPDSFLLASKRLGISPENLVVIEDAEKGVIAAKSAGMKCIAIPSSSTLNNDFSNADFVLKDINQLTPSLIKSL